MAVTIRETQSAYGVGADATVTTSANVAVGDIIICFSGMEWDTTGTILDPTGGGPTTTHTWTKRTEDTRGSGNAHMKTFTTVVTEAGVQTITCRKSAVSSADITNMVVVLQGSSVHSSWLEAAAAADTGASQLTAHAAPSVDIAGNDTLLLTAHLSASGAPINYTAPSGMTAAMTELDTPQYATMAVFKQDLTAIGATGTRTATASAARYGCMATIAIKSVNSIAIDPPPSTTTQGTSSAIYPTTVASTVATTWTNTANATGSTAATFATWTNATANTVGSIQLSGYPAQSNVNGGVQPTSIDSIAVTVKYYVAATNRYANANVQLYSGTTAIGSPTALTLSATTTNVQTVTLTGANLPTWSQMANLQARVSVRRGTGTQSSTANVDYVGMTISWTHTTPISNYVSGSALTNSRADSVANTTWTLATASFTPAVGNVLVIKAASGSQNVTATGVSGGGLTWTKRIESPNTASNAYASIWTATATSATAMTATVTFSNASSSLIIPSGISLERYNGVKVATTPATNTVQNTSALSSINATKQYATITWVGADWNGVTGTTTYLSPGTVTSAPYQNSGRASFYYAQQTTPGSGTRTYGLTAPTGQKSTLVALELEPLLPKMVQYDATGPSAGVGIYASATNTLSWTHTVGSGSDMAMIVSISYGAANSTINNYTLSVTCGGTTMTSLAKRTSNNGTTGYTQMFGLLGVTAGAKTIVVTVTGGNATSMIAGSVSFRNVASFGTPVTSFGATNPTTISITGTATTNMVVVHAGGANRIYPLAAQATHVWHRNLPTNNNTGADAAAVSIKRSIVGTMNFSYPTDAAEAYGNIAVELNGVATGYEDDPGPGNVTLWKATTDPPSTATTNVLANYEDNGNQRQATPGGTMPDLTTPWPLPAFAAEGGRPGRAIRISLPSPYTRVEHLPSHKQFSVGDEYYFSQAFYLAAGFPIDNDYFQIIEQIHHDGNNSPPIAFEVFLNSFRLTGGNTPYAYNELLLSTIETERWYTYVYRVNFSDQINGSRISVWVDGVLRLDNFQIPTPTVEPGAGMSYRKQGIYHGLQSGTLPAATVYSAGSAYGTSYAAVDPTLTLTPNPKIDTVSANFNDNQLPAFMTDGTGPGNYTMANGQLTINGATFSTYRAIHTTNRYDLSNSAAHVEIVSPGNMTQTSRQTIFYAEIDSTNKIQWELNNGQAKAMCSVDNSNQVLATLTYSQATHKYFRLRAAAGVTYWEWSTTGASNTWTIAHQQTSPIPTTNLQFGMMLGNWQAEASATNATFDNFNITTAVATQAPTVTTSAATNVMDYSASGNGEVTNDGGAIDERGFVVALQSSADPTTTTNIGKFTVLGTSGVYSGNISGLSPQTAYKYRAYATNAIGTSYGSAVNFTTLAIQPIAYLGTPDNFNDNTLATQWDPSSSYNRYMAVEKNQQLELSHNNDEFTHVRLVSAGSLVGKTVSVRVVNAGTQTAGHTHVAQLAVYKDANNTILMEVKAGVLKAMRNVAGTWTQIGADVTYAASTHQYWRIREDSGTVYFDTATTASGGSTWTNRFSVLTSALFDISNGMRPTLTSGNDNTGTPNHSSFVYFDDFNGGGTPDNDQLSWKGYNWQRRQTFEGGLNSPSYNGQYLPQNVSLSGGNLHLSLTNPTGNSPYACEVYTVERGFGYGTYTTVYEGSFSTMHKSIVMGGLFTFDFDTLPTNNEIDVAEISAWDNSTGAVLLDHTYFINDAGAKKSTKNVPDFTHPNSTTYPIMTHRMIWSASSIIWDSFGGTATSGWTHIKRTTQTTGLPVPSQTGAGARCHLNLWVFQKTDPFVTSANPATATPFTAIIRDFSFATETNDPGTTLLGLKPTNFMPFLTGF